MEKIASKISVVTGDITKVEVDAIVNAANSSLMGGGGVDGAIHRAGGPEILAACKEIVARQGLCKTGEAIITTAGKLNAKYVIHTVGPVWNGGTNNEESKLANCYKNSLVLSIKNNCKSIAFPNISTGVYRFPKEKAATITIKTVAEVLAILDTIEEVIFVCFDKENKELVEKELEQLR